MSAGRPRGRGGDPTPYNATHKPWLSLPAAPAKVLRTHHANQAAEALALGPAWLDSGLVFTSTVGTVIEPRNLNRFFDELIAKACVRRIRFHDLRHTSASLLAQSRSARAVIEILGDSQLAMTTTSTRT